MFREGHLGVSLLIATGFAAFLDGWLALGAGVLIVVLEPLPDLDVQLKPILADYGIAIEHRGATHSLACVAALGLVFGAVGLTAGYPLVFAAAAMCSILGHIAGDVITPMGVSPLWPLRDETVSLDLWNAWNTPLNTFSLIFGLSAAVTAIVGAG